MRIISLLSLLLLSTTLLSAQIPPTDSARSASDTTRPGLTLGSGITLHLSGGHLFQETGGNRAARVSHRATHDPALAARWGADDNAASDNPLYHGGSWLSLGLDLHAVPGLRLHGELVGEHRGISYGVGNTANMIVFPRALFTLDTAIDILGEKIRFGLSVGDSVDARIDQGLTFYNIDVQGTFARIGWRWLALYYENVGDGLFGIGLGIDDATHYGVAVENVPIVEKLRGGVRVGAFDYGLNYISGSFDEWLGEGIIISARFSWDSIAHLYGSWGTREVISDRSDLDATALLIGLESQGEWGIVRWRGRAEYRRYSQLFNADQINYNVYYRDTARGSYGNTIGSALYPLQRYLRPYNQWAVYTQRQNQGSVSGPSVQGDAWVRIYGALRLRLGFDMGDINVESGSPSSYAFYALGLGWEPQRGTSIEAALTNRAMNLDEHYPTLYEYFDPVVEVSLRWNMF